MKMQNFFLIKLSSLFFSVTFICGQLTAQLSTFINVMHATACTAPCNGSATATVFGGTPPYAYAWSTSPIQTTGTATGLCPGTYTVVVVDAVFNSDSAIATVQCVGAVFDYSLNQYLQIFPNPANGEISVLLSYPNGGTVKEISVYNTQGEKVFSEKFSNANKFSEKISTGMFFSGIYFIEMKDEKNIYRTKFLKQ